MSSDERVTGGICTGSPNCVARPHQHGCFADNGDCDDPTDHADWPGRVAYPSSDESAEVLTCPDCGNQSADDNGCPYSSTCECPTCGTAAYCDGAC